MMSHLPRFEHLLDQQPEPEEAPAMTFSYDMEDALSGDEARRRHGWLAAVTFEDLVGGDWNMDSIVPYIGNNHPN